MNAYFLDTNVFLQCKALGELPWKDVANGNNLLLVIPRPVQEEIDKFKNDGNGRKSKRARKISALFKKIKASKDKTLVIQNTNPVVKITFAPIIRLTNPEPDILDFSLPDDRIIAAALSYKANNPDVEVSLLTYDTNPSLTAENCDLSCITIPDEWLLPPEPDSKDKVIAKLEENLQALKQTFPEISVELKDSEVEDAEPILIDVIKYKALSDTRIAELVSEIRTKYSNHDPLKTSYQHFPNKKSAMYQMMSTINRYVPPSDNEIEDYLKHYSEWLESLDEYFGTIHEKLESQSRDIKAAFKIYNTGNVPADNILVEFKTHGDILIIPPHIKGDKNENILSIPMPPLIPEGKWVDKFSFDPISALDLFDEPPPRRFNHPLSSNYDKNAFHSKSFDLDDLCSHTGFKCDEFRHKVEPVTLTLNLSTPQASSSTNGAISCVVTARNLLEPYTCTIPIQINYREGEIEKFLKLLKT